MTTYFDTLDEKLAALDDGDDEETSEFITEFMIQTLSTVLLDGAVEVTDGTGNRPGAWNDYLMAADGKSFSGRVKTAAQRVYEFTILERANGAWAVNIAREAVF